MGRVVLERHLMGQPAMQPDHPELASLAKHIRDLQQLVTLLQAGLSRAKPWERQLAGHLADVDQKLQVLRLTVAMEKEGAELQDAADAVAGASRLTAAALAGSRVDPTTRTGVHLMVDLASRTCAALAALQR